MHFCWNNKIYQSAQSKNSLICRIKVIGAVTFERPWHKTLFKTTNSWRNSNLKCYIIVRCSHVITLSWPLWFALVNGPNTLIMLQHTPDMLLPGDYLYCQQHTVCVLWGETVFQHMCWWLFPNLLIHMWLRDYWASTGPNQRLIKS